MQNALGAKHPRKIFTGWLSKVFIAMAIMTTLVTSISFYMPQKAHAVEIMPSVSDCYRFKPLLKIGVKSNCVFALQYFLRRVEGYVAIYPDRIFGSKTQLAVKGFQREYGLTQDGIVGNITWDVIWVVCNSPVVKPACFDRVPLTM